MTLSDSSRRRRTVETLRLVACLCLVVAGTALAAAAHGSAAQETGQTQSEPEVGVGSAAAATPGPDVVAPRGSADSVVQTNDSDTEATGPTPAQSRPDPERDVLG